MVHIIYKTIYFHVEQYKWNKGIDYLMKKNSWNRVIIIEEPSIYSTLRHSMYIIKLYIKPYFTSRYTG